MKDKIKRLRNCLFLVIFIIGLCTVCSFAAVASDINIVFTNVGKTGATQTSPGVLSSYTVSGKTIMPGYTMVKLSDLSYLGADIYVDGDIYYVYINGQTIVFAYNSTEYACSINYSISVPNGETSNYVFSSSGNTELGTYPQFIDGDLYVRLTDATYQAGALLSSYSTVTEQIYVYDFRVNSNNAWADCNYYIVGGSWLDLWNNKSNVNLSPNFKVSEIWSTAAGGVYYRQMKISVASLQTEENVRFHHNDNNSLIVTSGFRSWPANYGTSGGDKRSLHMRGRAIDACASSYDRTVAMYESIYDEFKGNYAEPTYYNESGNPLIWTSRVYGTTYSKSGAYEMEKMPYNGMFWVHLGVNPTYSSGR